MDNKWDCDEDSKGNDESRTESSIFLANIHKVMNRIVVEEGTRRIILAKSQMEMRNMFLNPQRKAILVTKWWKTWLNCVLLLGGK